jgi:aryl sulfotransferase
MAGMPFRYRSPDEDSARWVGFPFRDGDIVISTRSKTGTTWVQMICALLIFQTPELPAPLARLSPWLDHLIVPRDEVYAQLAAQQHRRFIKTHTPLDGIPLDPRATYIVTARHPLDMFVSLYHQGGNIDRARVRQLTGQPEPAEPPRPRTPLHDRLLRWIADDDDPREYPDSLPGLLWHLSDAWARRREPNVLLVHYDDLLAGLDGQMRRLARHFRIAVPEQAWPGLVRAATFRGMRDRADRLVPTAGIFKSNAAFFRRGTSGAGREVLSDEEAAGYYARVAHVRTRRTQTATEHRSDDPAVISAADGGNLQAPRPGTGQVSTDKRPAGRVLRRARQQAVIIVPAWIPQAVARKETAPMEHRAGYNRPYVP